MIPISTIITETKSETLTINYSIVVKFFGIPIYKRIYQSTLVDFEPQIKTIGFNIMPDLKEHVDDERDFEQE